MAVIGFSKLGEIRDHSKKYLDSIRRGRLWLISSLALPMIGAVIIDALMRSGTIQSEGIFQASLSAVVLGTMVGLVGTWVAYGSAYDEFTIDLRMKARAANLSLFDYPPRTYTGLGLMHAPKPIIRVPLAEIGNRIQTDLAVVVDIDLLLEYPAFAETVKVGVEKIFDWLEIDPKHRRVGLLSEGDVKEIGLASLISAIDDHRLPRQQVPTSPPPMALPHGASEQLVATGLSSGLPPPNLIALPRGVEESAVTVPIQNLDRHTDPFLGL